MTSLKAGYAILRRPIGSEVLPLWEWLPATISSLQYAAHTGKPFELYWKTNFAIALYLIR